MAAVLAVFVSLLALASSQMWTALDEYCSLPDSTYRYELLNLSVNGLTWRGTLVKMYSQSWLTPADWNRGNPNDPDPGVWWHYVNLIEPNSIDPSKDDTVLVYVTGGSNNAAPPTSIADTDVMVASTMAVALRMRAVILYNTPNQPVIFPSDPNKKTRSEDAVIAYTWAHFLNDTNDPYWILQLPMTKGIMRAADTAIDFWKSKATIRHYIPYGGSKRGWVTWTASLVDDRVTAICPIVMDFLNIVPSMHHMWRAYGGWTWTFRDYWEEGITKRIDDSATQYLADIVDVYSYIADPSRLNIPKLVISGTNDQFFQNDNDYFWWDQMREPKFRMMAANADHALSGNIGAVLDSAISFLALFFRGTPFPSITWSYTQTATEGIITAVNDRSKMLPSKVSMWSAPSWVPSPTSSKKTDKGRGMWGIPGSGSSPSEEEYFAMLKSRNLTDATLLRDWRESGGYPPTPQNPVWKETALQESSPGSGIWLAIRPIPPTGWEAFFVEFQYPVENRVLRLTTQVSQIPMEIWPYDDCYSEGCYGTLV